MIFRRTSDPLEVRLGYRFQSTELLEAALTHRSHANEIGRGKHYERLEFLGDAVLGVMTAEWLYERHPSEPEGRLSQLKSQLVSTKSLAAHARRLDLGAALKLGVGEERSGGRDKSSLLADSLEALFGAIWLDGGDAPARRAVRAFLEAVTAEGRAKPSADTKTLLQEVVQAKGWRLPSYTVTAEEGPDHSKRFTVQCSIEGEVAGEGEGRSKKAAEQRAAAAALERLSSTA